jgi:hypothetical protein
MQDMTNVHFLGMETKLPVPSVRVLQCAIDAGVESAIVIGIDKEGHLYFAASEVDAAEILFALERAKAVLMAKVRGLCSG